MNTKIISCIALIAMLIISCSDGNDDSTGIPQEPKPDTPLAGKFTKNVLIEDFSGTWCGFCPRVSYGIEKVLEQNIKAIPVTIHRNGGGGGIDPFHFEAATALINQISDFEGYPTATLDRKKIWDYPEPANINQVKNYTGNNADLGIAIKNNIASEKINVDVKVKFDADLSDLKLVVYVLESNLKYNQVNETSYYGSVSIIQDFNHNHVLRATLTNILGDNIIGKTTDGSIYTKSFSQDVPDTIENTANVSFVAFVLDSSGKVINSRSALLNEDQSFQENE